MRDWFEPEAAFPRAYKRPMPITRRAPKAKRPKREKTPCDACTLTGPELFASLWPAPEPGKPRNVGLPRLKRFVIGPRAWSAPTKSEARARYKSVHGPIPPGTRCYEWTHPEAVTR